MVHVPRRQGQRSRPRFSLYLASQLTYGVIYVYSKKVDYFHRDLQNFINNYKVSLQSIRDNITLPPRTNRGKRVVTLDDRINGDDEFGFIEPPIKRVRTEPILRPGVEPTVVPRMTPGLVSQEDEAFNFEELMREAHEPMTEHSPPTRLPATTASPDRTLVRSPEAITIQEIMLPGPAQEAATGLDFGLATDEDLDILADEVDMREPVLERTPPPVASSQLPPDAPERLLKPIPQSVTPLELTKRTTTSEAFTEPPHPSLPPADLERTPPSVGEPARTTTPPQPFPMKMPEEITPPSVGKPPSTITPPGAPTPSPTTDIPLQAPRIPVINLQDIDVPPRPPRRRRPRRRLIIDDDTQLPREDVNRTRMDQRERDIVTFGKRQNQRTPPHVLFTRPGGRGNFRAPALLRLFTQNCRLTNQVNFTDSPMHLHSPFQVQTSSESEEETEIDLPRDPSIDVSRQVSEPGGIGTPDVSSRTAADLSSLPEADVEPDDTYATLPKLPAVPEHEEVDVTSHTVAQEVEISTEAAEEEGGREALMEQPEETPEVSEAELDAQTSQEKEDRAIEALLTKIKEECRKSEAILVFRKLCPPTTFMRVPAAKMFSRLLAMHKLSKVYLAQQAPYEDIYIYEIN